MNDKKILKRTFNGTEIEFVEPPYNVINTTGRFEAYYSAKPCYGYVLLEPLFECPRAKGKKCSLEIILHWRKWLAKPSDYFNVNTCNCDLFFDKCFLYMLHAYLSDREYLAEEKEYGLLKGKGLETYERMIQNEKEAGL